MIPRIEVEFRITGTRKLPEEITQLVMINPTRTWYEGESIQGTNLKRKHNGWCLSHGRPKKNISIEDHISPLMNKLAPKAQAIKEICEEYELDSEVSCAIYIIDETPIINLSNKILEAISGLGAELDIDIILTRKRGLEE
jgi:hypothetical protein